MQVLRDIDQSSCPHLHLTLYQSAKDQANNLLDSLQKAQNKLVRWLNEQKSETNYQGLKLSPLWN